MMMDVHGKSIRDFKGDMLDWPGLAGAKPHPFKPHLSIGFRALKEFKEYTKDFEKFWKKKYEKEHGDISDAKQEAIISAIYLYVYAKLSPEAKKALKTGRHESEFWDLTPRITDETRFKIPRKQFKKSLRSPFLKFLLRKKLGNCFAYVTFIVCLSRFYGIPAILFSAYYNLDTQKELTVGHGCAAVDIRGRSILVDRMLNNPNARYKGKLMADYEAYANAWATRAFQLSLLEERQKKPNYDGAMQCANKALEIDPNSAIAWFTKGRILYLGLNEPFEAYKAFSKAEDLGLADKNDRLVLESRKMQAVLENRPPERSDI